MAHKDIVLCAKHRLLKRFLRARLEILLETIRIKNIGFFIKTAMLAVN